MKKFLFAFVCVTLGMTASASPGMPYMRDVFSYMQQVSSNYNKYVRCIQTTENLDTAIAYLYKYNNALEDLSEYMEIITFEKNVNPAADLKEATEETEHPLVEIVMSNYSYLSELIMAKNATDSATPKFEESLRKMGLKGIEASQKQQKAFYASIQNVYSLIILDQKTGKNLFSKKELNELQVYAIDLFKTKDKDNYASAALKVATNLNHLKKYQHEEHLPNGDH